MVLLAQLLALYQAMDSSLQPSCVLAVLMLKEACESLQPLDPDIFTFAYGACEAKGIKHVRSGKQASPIFVALNRHVKRDVSIRDDQPFASDIYCGVNGNRQLLEQ